MKVVVISDTHCQLDQISIPEGDTLVHCGDLTYKGTTQEVQKEIVLLKEKAKNFKNIILICGNHDWLGELNPSLMRQMCIDNGITYLENEEVTVDGFKFYGSPVTPFFCNWAFNVRRGKDIKKYWDKIPNNLDVLITHGPAYGRLDHVPDGSFCGCYDLLEAIEEKKPRYHLFGHIHFSSGELEKNGTKFINAAICDEAYKPINLAKTFILEVK